MKDSERHPRDRDCAPRTWRDRLEASLLIGALVTAVWMFVVLLAGAWPLNTTENLRGFLNAALNNMINLSGLALLIQVIWLWARSRRPKS